MVKEIWKDIDGYEGIYQVSNIGRVKRLKKTIKTRHISNYKELVLKQQKSTRGYMYVILYKNKKPKGHRVHRLVAKQFVDNKDNKNIVNHIDNNPLNNNANNLEWCTQKENINHAFRINACKNHVENCRKLGKLKAIAIYQCDKNGNKIKRWESGQEAGRQLNIVANNIYRCLSGERKTCGGYVWKYAD